MTSDRPMREMYIEYLAGRLSFDELMEATDRAAEAYEQRLASARAASPGVTGPERREP